MPPGLRDTQPRPEGAAKVIQLGNAWIAKTLQRLPRHCTESSCSDNKGIHTYLKRKGKETPSMLSLILTMSFIAPLPDKEDAGLTAAVKKTAEAASYSFT